MFGGASGMAALFFIHFSIAMCSCWYCVVNFSFCVCLFFFSFLVCLDRSRFCAPIFQILFFCVWALCLWSCFLFRCVLILLARVFRCAFVFVNLSFFSHMFPWYVVMCMCFGFLLFLSVEFDLSPLFLCGINLLLFFFVCVLLSSLVPC